MTGALHVYVSAQLEAIITWRVRHDQAMELGDALVGAILEPHPGRFVHISTPQRASDWIRKYFTDLPIDQWQLETIDRMLELPPAERARLFFNAGRRGGGKRG